jgi:hypothetical protein
MQTRVASNGRSGRVSVTIHLVNCVGTIYTGEGFVDYVKVLVRSRFLEVN